MQRYVSGANLVVDVTALGLGIVHPTTMEGSWNSKREPRRLQNRPENCGSLQRPQQANLLKSRTTGHVNLFMDIEINNLQLSNRLLAIKGPLPFRRGGGAQEHFSLSLSELFELSAHPILTLFFFLNTKNAGRRAITSYQGPEPG
jgi:hypothetical protein